MEELQKRYKVKSSLLSGTLSPPSTPSDKESQPAERLDKKTKVVKDMKKPRKKNLHMNDSIAEIGLSQLIVTNAKQRSLESENSDDFFKVR